MSVDESMWMTEHVSELWCMEQELLLRKPLECFVQKLSAAAVGGLAVLLPSHSPAMHLNVFPSCLGFGHSQGCALRKLQSLLRK